MKSRKLFVFLTIHITFVSIVVFLAFVAKETLQDFWSVFAFAILANGAVYITGNVADAWQISKNYKWQLDPGMQSETEKTT